MTLYKALHPRAIIEFSYRYSDPDEAYIYVAFSVTNRVAELDDIFSKLKANGMRAIDISHNEMAKTHARYLVGGHKEVIFLFLFFLCLFFSYFAQLFQN